MEEFHSIVQDIHERDLLCGGYKKTFEKVYR